MHRDYRYTTYDHVISSIGIGEYIRGIHLDFYLRIDTGGCSVIRATPVFYHTTLLHSSIRI